MVFGFSKNTKRKPTLMDYFVVWYTEILLRNQGRTSTKP